MEQVRHLNQLVSKTAPGRTPDFTPSHLLYTLTLLEEQRIGRKQLAIELRLGEGTIRTILGRLLDKKLVEVSRLGISLSPNGIEFLNSIRSVLLWKPLPSTELTVDAENWVTLVRGVSDRVRFGVEQRDMALIHGATGATTIVFIRGIWVIPGINENVDDSIIDSLEDLAPYENDVAIIGSSLDKFTAALGSIAAAIDLLV
jgi:hypothetical protein